VTKVTYEQAKASVEGYKKMKAKAKPKRNRQTPKAKKGKPANWATRLKAKVKVEFAKRAQKKAYANMDDAEKRKAYATKRTGQVTSALKKAGVSDKKINRMRGGKY